MYLEDEFSKRERVTEDFYRIFDRLEMSPDIVICVRDILSSDIPLKDALNPEAIEKSITNAGDIPYQINTYPFGKPTNQIYPSFLAVCNKKNAFRQTLAEMVNHGIKYGDIIKEMVMLTNYWDSKDFKEYEESINALYDRFGIRTSVILITEYSANIVF